MTPHPGQARVEEIIKELHEWAGNPHMLASGEPVLTEAADALSELLSLRASPSAGEATAEPFANWTDERWQRFYAVPESAVEAGLHAYVPGGAEAWHWLPQRKTGGPDETAHSIVRAIIAEAAAPSPSVVTREPSVTGLIEAARAVVKAYDECSGYEPSQSVLDRAIDVDLRAALTPEPETQPVEGWQARIDKRIAYLKRPDILEDGDTPPRPESEAALRMFLSAVVTKPYLFLHDNGNFSVLLRSPDGGEISLELSGSKVEKIVILPPPPIQGNSK